VKRFWIILLVYLFWSVAEPCLSAWKRQYGGNVKVAEELLAQIRSQELFTPFEDGFLPLFPLDHRKEEDRFEINLSPLNPDQITEWEKYLQSFQDSSHPCHWILDFPSYSHEHSTSIVLEDMKLILRNFDSDSLNTVLTSSCLAPPEWNLIVPFRKTQFGFEANADCLAGRPFLDSITPVPVDPMNPYLSFKLNDVDVIPVPEERYAQISNDPDIAILPGPRQLIYLKTTGLTEEQVTSITAAINLQELAKSVLNNHVEILFPGAGAELQTKPFAFSLRFPPEDTYGLMGERLLIQWKDAGFTVSHEANRNPTVEVMVAPIRENDFALFRYRLLKKEGWANDSGKWFEIWDHLEASGRLVPLMIHITRIAYRKNLQELKTRSSGMPDFANCWLIRNP
jgi:hypothetical protein